MLTSKIVWHPYPDEKPITNGSYLITYENRAVTGEYFNGSFIYDNWVTAWAEMPEPYGGEADGN